MYCVENHQVVIVVGQTGCGKTTRMLRLDVLQAPAVSTIIISRNPTIPPRERLVLRRQSHSLHTAPSRRSHLCGNPYSSRDGLSGGRGGWLIARRIVISHF